MILGITITLWVLLSGVVSGISLGPFGSYLNQRLFQTPFTASSNDHVVHYSEIADDELPINLQQYVGDVVVRIDYGTNKELQKFLISGNDDAIQFEKWGKHSSRSTIDIQISEANLHKLVNKFSGCHEKLNYQIIVKDLAQTIYETYPKNDFNVMEGDIHTMTEIFFNEYRPLDTIYSWLDLIQESYPELISIETIGRTYEDRPYQVVHLSIHNEDIDHKKKKTIVITAGVHAREWIAISTSLYLIYQMVQYYEANPENHKILSELDFLFIPVLNPDGYVYTWEHDRLWRKNRQVTPLSSDDCIGIDIDHSYDFHWTRSSDNICGEEYSGEKPFDAYESRIWEDYLNATNHHHTIWGYLDIHSYSQEILMPYAFSCEQLPRDQENLIELAYGISKAIRMQLGKNYDVLPACLDRDSDLLPDLGAGTALDFMYHNRAYWAYQLKLRDSGNHGFLLPHKYITPVGAEIYEGFKYFCQFILQEY